MLDALVGAGSFWPKSFFTTKSYHPTTKIVIKNLVNFTLVKIIIIIIIIIIKSKILQKTLSKKIPLK